MKRSFAVLLVVWVVCLLFVGCPQEQVVKSDKELINARLDTFLTAHNSGDLEGVLDCMDAKTRNAYKSAIRVSETLVGNLYSCLGGLSYSDMWAMGIGTVDGDVMTLKNRKIKIKDDTHATVRVTMTYKEPQRTWTGKADFIMRKEKGDWYIQDIEPQS